MGIYGKLLMIQEQQELEANILREFDIIYESEQTKKSIIQKIVELIERFKQFILRKIKEIKQKLAKLFVKRKDKLNELEKKVKEEESATTDKEEKSSNDDKEEKSSNNDNGDNSSKKDESIKQEEKEKPFKEFEIEYIPVYDDAPSTIALLRTNLSNTNWANIEDIDKYSKSINLDLKDYYKVIKRLHNICDNFKSEKVTIHSKEESKDFRKEIIRCKRITGKMIGNLVENDFTKVASEIVIVMGKLEKDIKSLENKNIDGDLNQLIASVKNVLSMLSDANYAAKRLMQKIYQADNYNRIAYCKIILN